MTDAFSHVWRVVWYTRMRDFMRGRLNASLDWRAVITESGLPAEIQGAIGQVVRGSRLRRGEKCDVANELIVHFQDGLEAGQSPSELVKSFGDVRQAALLIRRAKKRGRSIVWHMWRYACWAVGAAMVAYLAAGLWMMMDRPTVAVDYLAMLNKPAIAVPEKERAWPLYREALLAMNAKSAAADPYSPFVIAANSKPGDANWDATLKFLTEHAGSIDKLRAAAARHELGFVATSKLAAFSEEDRKLFGVVATPEEIEAAKQASIEDSWIIATLLPHLDLLRQSAMLLANDARRAAAAGDGQMAAKNIVALYGISRHSESISFLVNLLVSANVQRIAHTAIQDLLRDYPGLWTNDQLRDLAHETAASKVDWRKGFEGERTSFYDSMQRVYTDDGNGDGRLALYVGVDTSSEATIFDVLNSITTNVADLEMVKPPLSNKLLAMLAMPATNALVASRKEMTDTYDRLAGRALELLENPLWETEDAPSIDDEAIQLQQEPFGEVRYLFVNLLFPSFEALRTSYVTAQGERDGVLVGLALELYHRENKQWPKSLAELSPRWLPELPVDLITGKPLQLKIVDDRPVVYSIGVDGKNDGGKLPVNCEGDPRRYPVSSASQWNNQDVTEHSKNQFYGDWVIWSTVNTSNESDSE